MNIFFFCILFKLFKNNYNQRINENINIDNTKEKNVSKKKII